MRLCHQICVATLLLHLSCLGQIDFTEHYFPYIHQADLEVVDGDYTEALSLYHQAFENVHVASEKSKPTADS